MLPLYRRRPHDKVHDTTDNEKVRNVRQIEDNRFDECPLNKLLFGCEAQSDIYSSPDRQDQDHEDEVQVEVEVLRLVLASNHRPLHFKRRLVLVLEHIVLVLSELNSLWADTPGSLWLQEDGETDVNEDGKEPSRDDKNHLHGKEGEVADTSHLVAQS